MYVICDIPKAVEDFLKTESDSGRELLDIAQKDNSANSFNCTAENHAAIEESTENVRDTSRWYPHNYRDRNVMDSSVLRFDSPRIRSESDIGLFVNRSDSQSMPSNQTSNSMGRYINNIVTSDVVGRHNRIPVIHGIEASNGIDYNAGRQNASTITTVANSMMDRLRRHANRYALLSNDHDDRSDLNPTNATINRDIERGQHMQIELSSRPSNLIQPSTGENIMTLSPVDESHYGGEEVTSPLLEISTSGVLSLDTAHDSNSENPSFMDHGEHIIFRHRQLLQKITKFIEQLPVRDAKIPSEACDQGSDQRISGLVNNDSSKCNQCIVCFDTEIDTAIMPCGHSVMCLGCCLILAEHSSGGHCPVCRTSMKAIFQFATKPFAVPIDRNLNDVTTNSTGSHGSENNIGENVVVTVSNRCYRIERVTRPVYRGSINPGFRGDREPGDRPILRNQEIFHHFNSSGMANVDAFPNTVSTYAIDSNVAMNNIVLDLFS